MKSYNIIVQDIYEKNKQKHFVVEGINPQLAHKAGLRHTNALREEISLIKDKSNNVVFTFRDGFTNIDE
jgi:hypothetical protein